MKIAVVLIDMQPRFFRVLDRKTQNMLLKAQIAVLRHCALNDIPVVVLEYTGCGKTLKALRMISHSVPRIRFIKKMANDGFYTEEFEHHIRSLAVTRLIFAGVNASFCVYATAKGAVKRGYTIATSENLIANQRLGCMARLPHVRFQSKPWYEKNGIFLKRHEAHTVLFQN